MSGSPNAWAKLYGQVCAHFALEERLTGERKYGLYDAHKADHEALLADMRYTMDAYEAGACETRDTTPDQRLTSWFHKHFRAQDARLEALRP